MRIAFEEKLAESLKVQTELKQLEDKYFYSRERSREQVDSVLKVILIYLLAFQIPLSFQY